MDDRRMLARMALVACMEALVACMEALVAAWTIEGCQISGKELMHVCYIMIMRWDHTCTAANTAAALQSQQHRTYSFDRCTAVSLKYFAY
jgi:hypothetical protein